MTLFAIRTFILAEFSRERFAKRQPKGYMESRSSDKERLRLRNTAMSCFVAGLRAKWVSPRRLRPKIKQNKKGKLATQGKWSCFIIFWNRGSERSGSAIGSTFRYSKRSLRSL